MIKWGIKSQHQRFCLFIRFVIEKQSNYKVIVIKVKFKAKFRNQQRFKAIQKKQNLIDFKKCRKQFLIRVSSVLFQQCDIIQNIFRNIKDNQGKCIKNSSFNVLITNTLREIYKMLNLVPFLQYFFILQKPFEELTMSSQNNNAATVCGNSRLKLMQNAKEIFSCQCGKKYLTFCALYLHVKIKHDVRLSIKKSGQNHHTDIDGCKLVKTYFFKQANPSSPFETQNSTHKLKNKSLFFKDVLNQYRLHLKTVDNSVKVPQEDFLSLLEGYFNQIAKQLDGDTTLPMDMSYYFNQFSVFYLPKHRKTEGKDGIETLRKYGQKIMALWEWSREQKMTEVDLKLDQVYCTHLTSSEQ